MSSIRCKISMLTNWPSPPEGLTWDSGGWLIYNAENVNSNNASICTHWSSFPHCTFEISMIFNSCLRVQNLVSSKGLVKISASWASVLTWHNWISFFSTWSLRKWCLTSMCLDLWCWTRLLANLIALSLSQRRGTWDMDMLKSFKVCLIHNNLAQQLPAAMYSASAVDRATEFCFLELQDTREHPRNWQVPEVLFLSTLHPA